MIKVEVDSIYIATDVMMTVQYRSKYRRKRNLLDSFCILLVEGTDDAQIYRNFIDKTNCEIQICEGKHRIDEVVEFLSQWDKGFRGFLAIKDADYDALDGKAVHSHEVFTDGHDLEVMILVSDALEVLIDALLERKIDGSHKNFKADFRKKLFNLGSRIGYVRHKVRTYCKGNGIGNWGILCDQLTVELLDLLDNRLDLDFNRVHALLQQKPGLLEFDVSEINSKDYKRLRPKHNNNFCHGKDMREILRILIPKSTKIRYGRDMSRNDRFVWETLFESYDKSQFRSTQLFQDIKSWENKNPPLRVLDD